MTPRPTSGIARPAPEPGEPLYQSHSYCAEDSVAYLMRRILQSMGQQAERELEPSGLTNAQWVPLYKLFLGQAGTVAELARECELDAGAMTRLLDRLEAKGLCRRLRSADDRRVVKLELTDAGRASARGIPPVLSAINNAHLAGFSRAEWETLKGLLHRMLANAQQIQSENRKP